MSKKVAMVLSVYLLIGLAVAAFDVVDHAGRGFVNEVTIGAAARKGVAWPVILFSVLAEG